MKKVLMNLLILFPLIFSTYIADAKIDDYCVAPPFTSVAVPPNVLFVVDVSGSMGWCAYNPNSNKRSCCDKSSGCGWTYKGDEEGYFDPNKIYKYNSSKGYWEETTGSPATCPKRTGNIDHGKLYQGSCLNFLYMSRVDLVRWAITGGRLDSCRNYDPKRCDPELYGQPSANLSCDSYGCVLVTYTGVKIKVPWDRINSALVYRFKEFSLRPRIGVLFYSGNGIRHHKVYIGDFTGSASFDDVNPYKNTIAAFNTENPCSSTPTGPALWDAYNYYAQNSAEYGGFTPQSGTGDKWKNPFYQCQDQDNNGVCQGSELIFVPCAKNFVILLSDGQWNRGGSPGSVTGTCTIERGYERHSADPVVPAYWMHAKGFTNNPTGVKSKVDSVYTIGIFLGGTGALSLKNVAMYGSFLTYSKTWPGNLSDYPRDTCRMDDCGNGRGSACTPLPPSSHDWDKNNDGEPDTFYSASNATQIKEAILHAMLDILKRASSGTAVSVLSTSTRGSGFISQAYFFPSMTDEQNKEFSWVGELKGLWIDQAGNIREDTDTSNDITGAVAQLELDKDKILKFYNDGTKILTHTYSSDANGTVTFPCTFEDTKELGNIISIWDIGKQLWETDPNNRNIKTTVGSGLIDFSSSNYSSLKVFLRAYDDSDAQNIINYIRGQDVDICMDSDDATCNNKGHRDRTITINGASHVWKLGDIIQSTPRVLSHFPLNTYHINYDDTTYLNFIKEHIYDPNSASPVKRNDYLFVGANDGMLHCFYLGGIASSSPDGTHPGLKAILKDPESKTPGTELWAYIPMNVLPYLKYLAYTEYCHIYYVDQRAMLLDASIGGNPNGNKTKDSWKTILIGELRFGGCSKSSTLPSDTPCLKDGQVVSCSTSGAKKVGYSSIFALDITDPENPSLLWEFSDPSLGFTTSYPTVVRFGDKGKNGNWYLIVGSGPTDYEGDYPPSEGYLFVIDLKTGDLVGKLSMGTDTYVGDCVAIDPDIDYNVNAIYCGTVIKNGSSLKGKMMRILTPDVPTVDANKNITNWDLSTLVDADAPITAAPEFTFDEKGNLWCYFGTGKYFGQTDKIDTTQQYLFGVKDTCWGYDTSSQKWKYNTSCTEVTDIIDVSNITVNGTINDYYCECEGGKVDCCQYDNNNNCTQYAKGTDNNNNPICNCGNMIVTELKNITVNNCVDNSVSPSKTYSNWNSCANFISSKDGWKRQLSVSSPAERCISKPAVIGQIAMYTTFKPNDDICGFGGDTYLYSLYYKAGIPYWQPTILRENAVTGNGQISAGVNIGKGAPPIGESISTRQVKGKTKTYVQLSTGEVVEVSQKTVFLPNKTQFWIER